ncbi:MAG: hypothetical protein A2X80_05660 [Geobacteraceae bacterium GWB2_52_12]|nr:MAG: hypothetical protein A2X80_05660 [Geobacteraceae bacterium GWB2_52_12]
MNQKFKKIIATTLVAVMVCLSINTVFSFAHEVEEAGFSTPHNIAIDFLHIKTSGHCPSCPTDDHPITDHDHFSCDHHNYLSLVAQTVYIHPLPMTLPVVNSESFQFIPTVYLDKFIPPQNLA